MAELWSIIKPLFTKNYITNPSFVGNTGWGTGSGNTGAETYEQQYKGTTSRKTTTGGTNSQLLFSVSYTLDNQNTTYYLSCYVYVVAGWDLGTISLDASLFTSATITKEKEWTTANETGKWIRLVTKLEVATDVTGTFEINAASVGTSGKVVYIDAFQVEEQPDGPTTYCDGDQPGCRWIGTENLSVSERFATSRQGGIPINLSDHGFKVIRMDGIGLPPLRHKTKTQAFQDGAKFEGVKTLPRTFVVTSKVAPSGSTGTGKIADLHSKRQAIIDLIKPDLISGEEEFILRYTGGDASDSPLDIKCVYDGGMDYGNLEGFIETIPLRVIAYDPYFLTGDGGASITTEESLGAGTYFLDKTRGDWETIPQPSAVTDPGGGIIVHVIIKANDGKVYVAGDFLNWDGIANADYIAVWNPETEAWGALGTGMNGSVRDLVIAPNGDLYACGDFTTAGGTTVNRCAYWNGSAWAKQGDGLNAVADAMVITRDNLYIVGSFTTDDTATTTLNYVARSIYPGGGWTTIGTGPGFNAAATDIAEAPNGDIYACGTFTQAGADTVNYIARFTGTGNWTDLASGANTTINTVTIDKAGILYAAGQFATIGGVSAAKVAKWNGVSWAALGSGVTATTVRDVEVDNLTGLVYFVGQGLTAAGGNPVNGVAIWNGVTWVPLDAKLATSPTVREVYIPNEQDELYLGWEGSLNPTVSGRNTITNTGTTATYPKMTVKLSGVTGTFKFIENVTTGDVIWFNHSMGNTETIEIDFKPGNKRIISTWSGDISSSILRNSNFARFRLLPGENIINVFLDQSGGTVDAEMLWPLRHWSADGLA